VRRRGAVALALAAFAAGCGDDGAPAERAATASPVRPTATVSSAAIAAPRARTVAFKSSDGVEVSGEYTPAGRRSPAVVLLHEIRGGPRQWDELVARLHAAGFATLAYVSRPSVMERERIRDLLGAVRWLHERPDVDRGRLGLVGASIGASTAVFAMATGTRATVDAAVALSPPDSADIWRLQTGGRYRPHDVLMVSDERESTAVDGMMDGAVRSQALRSRQAGHGVALLAETRVRDALLDWLSNRVR
jgi:cephalosporin-C deacetylase-like acetyl esterase